MAMRITVLGTDYEGLTISVGLATLGHSVTTVNTDHHRIRQLQRGMPIEEDETLSEQLKMELREGQLKFISEPESCLGETDVVIIAGAPGERRAVLKTAECLSGAIASYSTVLVAARTPVGSCRMLQDWLNDAMFTAAVNVVAFPVFFNPPRGLQEFLHPGRIVLGYEQERARRVMDELFASFLLNETSISHVSWEAAEMMRTVEGPFSTSVPGENPLVETVVPVERVYSSING